MENLRRAVCTLLRTAVALVIIVVVHGYVSTFMDTPMEASVKGDAGTAASKADSTSYGTICLVTVLVLAMAIISILSFVMTIITNIASVMAEMFPPIVIRVPPLALQTHQANLRTTL